MAADGPISMHFPHLKIIHTPDLAREEQSVGTTSCREELPSPGPHLCWELQKLGQPAAERTYPLCWELNRCWDDQLQRGATLCWERNRYWEEQLQRGATFSRASFLLRAADNWMMSCREQLSSSGPPVCWEWQMTKMISCREDLPSLLRAEHSLGWSAYIGEPPISGPPLCWELKTQWDNLPTERCYPTAGLLWTVLTCNKPSLHLAHPPLLCLPHSPWMQDQNLGRGTTGHRGFQPEKQHCNHKTRFIL